MTVVTNIISKESIANDELGLKSQEFIEVCNKYGADSLGIGSTVCAFIKAVPDSLGKPEILGYALSIRNDNIETDDGTGMVYLVTARNRLRLFKTIDAVSSYLSNNGIFNFKVYNYL